MKKPILLLSLFLLVIDAFPQKTILIEKIGTSHKYYYRPDDFFKLRTKSNDSVMRGNLLSVGEQSITLFSTASVDIPVSDIAMVYKRYNFLMASAFTFAQAGIYFFLAILFNHLYNHQPVMTSDVFIISGACFAAAAVCFSFSEKRCKIGDRWKVKILDIHIR